MAGKKIIELPVAETLGNNDRVVIERPGGGGASTSMQATVATVVAAVPTVAPTLDPTSGLYELAGSKLLGWEDDAEEFPLPAGVIEASIGTEPGTLAAGDVVPDGALSDSIASWHTIPTIVRSPIRQTIYRSGITREGVQHIATFDERRRSTTRWPLRAVSRDDHNAPAIQLRDDWSPLAASTQHNQDSIIRTWKGVRPWDIDSLVKATPVDITFPGPTSYAHLIPRTNSTTKVAVAARSSTNSWWITRSADGGATWPETVRRLHAKPYSTFRIDEATKIGHFVTYQHPIDSATNDLRYFKIDLDSGAISNDAGVVAAGNLWTYTEPSPLSTALIGQTDMSLVLNIADTSYSFRVFDVFTDGSILIGTFNEPVDATTSMMYTVLRHTGTSTWVAEPLVQSGPSFGYWSSLYVAGCTFGASADEVIVARDDAGTSRLEVWTRSSGVWASDQIAQRTDAKFARPLVPSAGLLVVQEVLSYDVNDYQHYYADEVLFRY